MSLNELFDARDLPIVKLVPRSERKVDKREYDRLEASIRTVGLLEPLLVYDQGDTYEILEGRFRYRVLLDMGVEMVPCLVRKEREAFTANRMVNHLSPGEAAEMIRKSLTELDEETIASALAMPSIKQRTSDKLLKRLEPTVAKAVEEGTLTRPCARELIHVKPERQAEILELMQTCNDHSATFAKGLVLKTPVAKRAKPNGSKTPWVKAEQKKGEMLKRLQEAEQQQDFFSGLYRQYTTNLLKLVIYVRTLLANQRARQYLEAHHGEQVKMFDEIIGATGG